MSKPLPTQVDLLILGGGIHGAGIARDAVGRGLSVLLCERNDLACGTSQASSKLIHGGLRYLEHGEFRLVHEALSEREKLLHIAPHLIHPLTFYLPWDRHLRPRWLIRLGLFLYDHLSWRQTLPRSSHGPMPQPNPLKTRFNKGFCYSDCSVDDARLVILNAMDAHERGATILTHTVCSQLKRQQDQWHATLQSPSGSIHLTAKAVINATGAWVDDVHQQLIDSTAKPRIQKVQGSHLVFARRYAGDHAYILQHTDQRIVFVLPFGPDHCLVGTTDVPFEGAAEHAQLLDQEADYLCQVVNHYFAFDFKPQDALWHYSGVRALVTQNGKAASKISRDYQIDLDSQGGAPLLTILGGKLTTYRQLSNHALAQLAPYFGFKKRSWTETQALPGGDLEGLSWSLFCQRIQQSYPFLPIKMATRLARAYGSRMIEWLNTATDLTSLGIHFGADLYQAEVDYLCKHEWATCATDIVWRRSKIGLQLTSQQIDDLNHYVTTLCKSLKSNYVKKTAG